MHLRPPAAAVLPLLLALALLWPAAAPAQRERAAPPATPPEMQDMVGVLNLSDAGTNDVLDLLERFYNKPVLRQQSLPQVRITFNSRAPLTRGETILAIESLLALNGIAITDVGEQFLKAVPSGAVQQQVPRLLLESSAEAPSLALYSKFYRPQYLTIQEAAALVQPLMSQGAPIAIERAGSLMVTDSLINLQRIEEFLREMDRPGDYRPEMIFFQLKHTTARDVVSRLTQMQNGSLKRFLEGNTSFDGDERTNQILVFTHPTNTKLITDIINQLDINVAPATLTEVFHIKHGQAKDIVALIEEIVTGQKQARSTTNSPNQANTQGGAAPAAPTPEPARQRTGPTPPGERSLQFSDYLNITADERSNAVLASGTPSDLEYLKELIDKIDILLAQVRIEVVIAEVNLRDEKSTGADTLGFSYQDVGDTGTYSIVAGGAGGNSLSLSGNLNPLTITGAIGPAVADGRAQILSAPTIVTTHNQEATINVSESRPIITGSQTDFSNTSSVRSTVQYRDIGIELKVKPLIGANGVIQMEVSQKVESVIDSVTIDSNEQPVIGKRETKSYVSVEDGQLVILGGLQSREDTKSTSRMFILGQIPLLDALFSNRSKNVRRTELMIFLRPIIVHGTAGALQDVRQHLEGREYRESIETYRDTGGFGDAPKEPAKPRRRPTHGSRPY